VSKYKHNDTWFAHVFDGKTDTTVEFRGDESEIWCDRWTATIITRLEAGANPATLKQPNLI
jgi:hypothetical protein